MVLPWPILEKFQAHQFTSVPLIYPRKCWFPSYFPLKIRGHECFLRLAYLKAFIFYLAHSVISQQISRNISLLHGFVHQLSLEQMTFVSLESAGVVESQNSLGWKGS